MSHASGEVIHDAKVIGYFEYDGTAGGIAQTAVRKTLEEVDAHWREGPGDIYGCKCADTYTLDRKDCWFGVLLWSSYGGGFYWPAKVCSACNHIADGFDQGGDGWPNDGHPLREPR